MVRSDGMKRLALVVIVVAIVACAVLAGCAAKNPFRESAFFTESMK